MQTSTIKFSQTKTKQSNPQIFTIWSDEIEGRIEGNSQEGSKGQIKTVTYK